MKQKIQTLKGFRDFLPDSMRVRNYVTTLFEQVFQSFGFLPIQTPALEFASTLLGKNGTEADKLVYTFKDKGNRLVGLRYDLTIPISKVLSIYQNQINLPLKRYQIQPVWRADKPQKSRYREFTQCDIDTFGTSSPIADAEIIAIIYTCLSKLKFSNFTIRINSRNVLTQLLDSIGIKKDQKTVLQTLDKMNKIGIKGVTQELTNKAFPKAKINTLLTQIKSIKLDQNLQQVFDAIDSFDIPKSFYKFDPTLVRGLDYYTGTIFETYVTKPIIGSITGGGRYDNLIKDLGGPDTAAVGTTLGLDRIVDCIIDQNLLPSITQVSTTKILVTVFDESTQTNSVQIASKLTKLNINSFLYPQVDKLSKQFKYASSEKIPFVLVLGPDEIKNNTITIKNMTTGKQQTIKPKQLTDLLI